MKKHTKNIAFLFLFVFVVAIFLLFKWEQTANPSKLDTLINGIIIFLHILIIGGIGYWIFKASSGKSPAQLRKSIPLLFILFVIMALLVSIVLIGSGNYIFYVVTGSDTNNFIREFLQNTLPAALKQLSIWILITSIFLFYKIIFGR